MGGRCVLSALAMFALITGCTGNAGFNINIRRKYNGGPVNPEPMEATCVDDLMSKGIRVPHVPLVPCPKNMTCRTRTCIYLEATPQSADKEGTAHRFNTDADTGVVHVGDDDPSHIHRARVSPRVQVQPQATRSRTHDLGDDLIAMDTLKDDDTTAKWVEYDHRQQQVVPILQHSGEKEAEKTLVEPSVEDKEEETKTKSNEDQTSSTIDFDTQGEKSIDEETSTQVDAEAPDKSHEEATSTMADYETPTEKSVEDPTSTMADYETPTEKSVEDPTSTTVDVEAPTERSVEETMTTGFKMPTEKSLVTYDDTPQDKLNKKGRRKKGRKGEKKRSRKRKMKGEASDEGDKSE